MVTITIYARCRVLCYQENPDSPYLAIIKHPSIIRDITSCNSRISNPSISRGASSVAHILRVDLPGFLGSYADVGELMPDVPNCSHERSEGPFEFIRKFRGNAPILPNPLPESPGS